MSIHACTTVFVKMLSSEILFVSAKMVLPERDVKLHRTPACQIPASMEESVNGKEMTTIHVIVFCQPQESTANDVQHREVAEGEVVSFGYPTGYSSNLTCGWILRRDLEDNHFTSGIFLNITEVAVDTSFNHDYLEILGSNGSQLMLIELSKYSGNSMENSFFLKDPKVSVILHSGYKGNGARHFRFNFYESFDYCSAYPCMNGGVCRNNLHTRRVHGRTCECQTEQFHGYSCETRGKHDYTININHNPLLQLKTAYYYFKCGQLLAKQAIANGIIATAQFPRPYERSNCSWAIRVPEGSVIAIEFHTLDTNRHCRHCCHHASYVQIEDEGDSSHAKRFCGNSVPPLFYTMSNQVVVKLIVSLTAHSGIGFLLTYDANIWCKESSCSYQGKCEHDTNGPKCNCYPGFTGTSCEQVVCGGIITDREGIIRSPQNSTGTSAQHYFKGASCLWNFTVSGDSCVHLLFDFVDLRSDYANYKICDPERLDIYYLDTFTGGKQLLRSLCDEDDQIEIVSPSDNLIIDYKTVKDADYEHLGFLVRYQIDINDCTADKCGGNTICVDAFNSSYRCACKPGFTGPNCETKYSACSHFKPCKFGECTDSSDTFICVCEAGYTGKLCDIIMCLPVRLSEENGEIQSPFYPGAYPSNLNCSWILDFQYNRILALTFDQVSLGPANCSQDYIDIFYGIGTSVNGSGAAERLCGQQKGEHRFVIPFPSVKIVLITGNLTTHSSGFHLTYRAEVPSICNTYLCNTGTCHVLSSGDPICQCPEGVFGEHCEIEPKIKCNSRLTEATGSFVLSTGNSSEGTECGLEISPYAVARLTERKVYLRVLFSTLQPAECNENYLEINVDHTLPGEAGWFSSPNHPRDYPHDINCSWTISTPGSPVEVVFDFIDLEGKYPECTSDYIE
ncbi:hypothetical protein M513_07927 [Trichuris suis]|uniref:CUB domain protein n=1 Tax=Trichuris suis TaxID=68888 RepID=A0A085M1R7_9BILA|nr:hypothetical protein M513_07927 [Trichuris suis]